MLFRHPRRNKGTQLMRRHWRLWVAPSKCGDNPVENTWRYMKFHWPFGWRWESVARAWTSCFLEQEHVGGKWGNEEPSSGRIWGGGWKDHRQGWGCFAERKGCCSSWDMKLQQAAQQHSCKGEGASLVLYSRALSARWNTADTCKLILGEDNLKCGSE